MFQWENCLMRLNSITNGQSETATGTGWWTVTQSVYLVTATGDPKSPQLRAPVAHLSASKFPRNSRPSTGQGSGPMAYLCCSEVGRWSWSRHVERWQHNWQVAMSLLLQLHHHCPSESKVDHGIAGHQSFPHLPVHLICIEENMKSGSL